MPVPLVVNRRGMRQLSSERPSYTMDIIQPHTGPEQRLITGIVDIIACLRSVDRLYSARVNIRGRSSATASRKGKNSNKLAMPGNS